MYRSILVPLDGSSFGEHALPLAAGIARRAGARLRLVHVHDREVEPELPTFTPYRFEGLDALFADRRTAVEEGDYLDRLTARLQEVSALDMSATVLGGKLAGALEHFIRGSDGDLLVMTTHGRGPLGRLWLGSVADTLVRRAGKPVLLVRAREEDAEEDVTAPEPRVERILVSLDGSPLAEQVLPYACELGTLLGASVVLFTAVTAGMMAAGTFGLHAAAAAEEVLKGAHDYLERAAGTLCCGLQASIEVAIAGGDPAHSILEAVDRLGVGIVALATHGRGGLSRLVAGSVAEKVVRGTHIPVLLVRPTH
jgi:nucleotide-binding universal stress UspA family protein